MPLPSPRTLTLYALLSTAVYLGGCASSQSGSALGGTLEWMGLKQPSVPPVDLPPTERKVTLRLHAGDRLNTDPSGRPLTIVTRIYKLKDAAAFLAAPREAFKDAAAEKQAFGNDLVDVREIVLTPGQKHEVVETMPITITHIAVAAQFRAPAEDRWRFAFETRRAERTGITLGLHGCAMSVAAGEPVNTAPELLRVAGVQCR